MTHISLALVGLMWVLPFLHYNHQYPLTTFDQEWWAVMLGVLAMFTLAGKDYWRDAQAPRVIVLPLALIGIAFLQWALGKIDYLAQAMLYVLYLLFVAQLMLLGAWLRRAVGMDKVALFLALALLVGTELSAAIGVCQHFALHTWFDSVIVRKISAGLYGNIAQPNHFANYITLGLVSLGLLYQRGKLDAKWVFVLCLPLLFVLTLSGSRTSWLYLIALVVLSAWMQLRNRSLRPLLHYALAIIAGYLVMHGLVQLPQLGGQGIEATSLRTSDTSGHVRLYLWQEAIHMFMQSPLLGVGFGQFALHHLELQPLYQPSFVSGLYNNAHNVVMQLAAETGATGLLALLLGVGVWVYGLRHAERSASHWWCYALISVVAIHSLLEYPLWYAYFLAIIAVLFGMTDETHFRFAIPKSGRAAMMVLLLIAVVLLGQLRVGYAQLRTALTVVNVPGLPVSQGPMQSLIDIRDRSLLLLPYVDMFISNYISIDGRDVQQKLQFNSRVMHYIPSGEAVYRQAFLLAQDGRLADAKVVLTEALWSYPNNAYARQFLVLLAEKDAAHFSALLEFATQKEQEIASAVRKQ